MDRLVAALGGADRPRAAGSSAAARHARCCGPCGARGRSDGSAAGRARRSPSPATYGSRASQSRNVPCVPASAPQERGNSSYQVPKARALAIDDERELDRVASWRGCGPDGAWRPPRVRRRAPARAARRDRSRRAARFAHSAAGAADRRRRRAARPPRSSRSAPTSAAMRRSSASTRRAKSWRHDRKCVDPRRHRVAVAADRRSPRRCRASDRCPSGAIGASRHSVSVVAPVEQAGRQRRRGRR